LGDAFGDPVSVFVPLESIEPCEGGCGGARGCMYVSLSFDSGGPGRAGTREWEAVVESSGVLSFELAEDAVLPFSSASASCQSELNYSKLAVERGVR
jgi:hypothetical protein